MGLEGLNMVILFVRDHAAMKDWYEKVLGLRVNERMSSDEGQWTVLELPGGGPRLAIHGGLAVRALVTNEQGERPVPPVVPVFAVEGIEGTVASLKADGVVFVKEPRDLAGSGIVGADLIDPEGNLIQLVEVKR